MENENPLKREDWKQWRVPMRRAKMRCEYCDLDGSDNLEAFRQLCYGMDHLVPKSIKRDGSDEPGNLVIACNACNRRKGDFDPRDKKQGDATPRERMIENVKEYLRGDWGYHKEGWEAFRADLSRR